MAKGLSRKIGRLCNHPCLGQQQFEVISFFSIIIGDVLLYNSPAPKYGQNYLKMLNLLDVITPNIRLPQSGCFTQYDTESFSQLLKGGQKFNTQQVKW